MIDPNTTLTVPTEPTAAPSPSAVPSDASPAPMPVPVVPAGAPADQNPLDVLDQILKEAKNKAGEEKASEEAAEQQKLKEDMAQQKLEDQQHIAEQLAAIEATKNSEQQQAQHALENQQKQQTTEHDDSLKGSQILQLGHTKLQVPTE